MRELLAKRKQIKRKKPDFAMQDAHKKSRLKQKWRKPRGIDSKMRLNLRGYNKCVEPGYGAPKLVKELDKSGLQPILICTEKELDKINKEKQGVIISSRTGKKKRIAIIKKANELSVKMLNIKNPEEYIKMIGENMKSRKEEKKKKEKQKEEKKAKVEKKKEDKLADKVLSEEEKSAAEKKEKDKLLTKKEI